MLKLKSFPTPEPQGPQGWRRTDAHVCEQLARGCYVRGAAGTRQTCDLSVIGRRSEIINK